MDATRKSSGGRTDTLVTNPEAVASRLLLLEIRHFGFESGSDGFHKKLARSQNGLL